MPVLVLAPFARDTALTCDYLQKSGIEARSCSDIDELCRRLGESPGAVLVMEETLGGEALSQLLTALKQQPRWSDIPVLVLVDSTRKADNPQIRHYGTLGNVTLLTRPAHPVTLLSSVRSALRARERQYRLRDALGPYEESFSRLVEALPLAILVQVDGRVIYANAAAARLLGAANPQALIGQPLLSRVHPDSSEQAQRRQSEAAAGAAASASERWVRTDGEPVDVDVEVAPMTWGRRPGVRVIARASGARTAQLPAALRQIPAMLFQQDRELRYSWAHDGLFHRRLEEIVGRRDAELVAHGEEADALERFKREAMRQGGARHGRFRATVGGTTRHLEVRVEPVRDDRGATGLVGIAVDVSEHAALEERLRQQAEQLAQSDRRKSDFLAQLAHELRNPLAPIHNAVHVLRIQPEPPDPGHFKWAVDVIGRQVQQLTRLVDDLLDVARIAHGQVTLRRETVEVGRALAQAVEAVRPLAAARKQALTFSPPGDSLAVLADPARLVQIVGNLLNNAARYTPAGGHISAMAFRDGAHAVISVKDDGIGIAPDAIERIFEPFQQAAPPPDSAHAGLGIGLALVKHLTELHGGSVEALSEGPGKGAEFRVRLPLAQAARPARAEPKTTDGWRVLVVDDDPDVAQSFALLLGLMGYHVRAANNGATGLKTAASFRPHVVFIDIGLPDMDGYALARALRAAGGGQPMRLVALTGYTQDEVRERAVVAGFDAHLLKPVSTDTVERLLESFRSPA